MMEQHAVRPPFLIAHKRQAKAAVLSFAALALAAPILIVGFSPGHFAGAQASAIRLLGLYAFTFAFFNIMTGALSRLFYMVFNPAREYLFHIVCGATALGLALAHGIIVLVTHFYRGFSWPWVIGPVALVLLIVTVASALEKNRLRHVWRAIHLINYLIFTAVFVKVMIIGQDVSAATSTAYAMKSIMILYLVLAAAATLAQARDYSRTAARRSAAAKSAPTKGD